VCNAQRSRVHAIDANVQHLPHKSRVGTLRRAISYQPPRSRGAIDRTICQAIEQVHELARARPHRRLVIGQEEIV